MSNLNKVIEDLKNGETVSESEVKILCFKAKELFLEE